MRRTTSVQAKPESVRRPSGVRHKAVLAPATDPLEEALITRPLWDSREPEPAVHELLYRFAVGDEVGALAAAEQLLDGQRVPALTVSWDVLDEIPVEYHAALVLARVDGATRLSRVLGECGLSPAEALRTFCELVERRILTLR
jgi:hypothetical protein